MSGIRKRRKIVLALAMLTFAALVVAGIALSDRVVEEWYIWRLASSDASASSAAALRLGELRCQRAAPHLVKALLRDAASGESWVASPPQRRSSRLTALSGVAPTLPKGEPQRGRASHRVQRSIAVAPTSPKGEPHSSDSAALVALVQLGEPVLPLLRKQAEWGGQASDLAYRRTVAVSLEAVDHLIRTAAEVVYDPDLEPQTQEIEVLDRF